MAKHDPAEAASLLAEVIAEAEASLRYSDNAEAVHRMFDSYVSRVVYNRQRPDAGKHVELLPATLVFCYLESVKLLEESFAHADEALRCGVRCMEMAPTFSAAFRQTARAYMLVGDLESAASALVACLRIALQPEEIAIAYYQLAYVEWKAGRLDTGVACYLKSIMTSPVYGAQSTVELQELLHEPGARMVPRDEVDEVLDAAGIPVAPREELLDQLDEAHPRRRGRQRVLGGPLAPFAAPALPPRRRPGERAALARGLRRSEGVRVRWRLTREDGESRFRPMPFCFANRLSTLDGLRYNNASWLDERRMTYMAIQAPEGTKDLLPDEAAFWTQFKRTAAEVFGRYGYAPIETPVFEQTELFVRGIGEATDVVSKEMFTALSGENLKKLLEGGTVKAKSRLSLRPEGTAGVVRAVVQHDLVPQGAAPVEAHATPAPCSGPSVRRKVA